MQFVYKPEGVEPDAWKRWEFDANKLMSPEAEAIERHTGMTFGEWKNAVVNESVRALHGLLFVMLKRENATLKWDEVQFSMSEVDFELDDEEAAEVIAALEAAASDGPLGAAERVTLDLLRAQVAEAAAPKEEPAPSVSDDASTSGGSTDSSESDLGNSTS